MQYNFNIPTDADIPKLRAMVYAKALINHEAHSIDYTVDLIESEGIWGVINFLIDSTCPYRYELSNVIQHLETASFDEVLT